MRRYYAVLASTLLVLALATVFNLKGNYDPGWAPGDHHFMVAPTPLFPIIPEPCEVAKSLAARYPGGHAGVKIEEVCL